MDVVAPFGFYGSGNIGDEATLRGFACLLRRFPLPARVWVASMDPRRTARVEPDFRYYRYHRDSRRYWTSWIRRLAKAYVFPGGTPIMDGLGSWPLSDVVPMVQHARSNGKPSVFVGTGTETLERPESRRLVSDGLAGCVAHWSVRGARDRDRLLALGVPPQRVTVAADMAWLLSPAGSEFGMRTLRPHGLGGRRLIGVNVNAERALLAREPELFQKLAAALDALVETRGVSVVFLCNEIREGESYDKAAAARVQSHMRRAGEAFILPNEYWAPDQMMSLIAACDLTISTRYHFCLFSALQAVPFVAVSRSDKVADLCEDLAWQFNAVPGSLTVDALVHHADMLLEDRPRARSHLSARVATMAERALRNSVALDALREQARAVPRLHWLRPAPRQSAG